MSMVSVNLTLVVQIANFLVAYVIVRNLLLRPAIDVIEQEQEQAAQDLKTIETYLRSNGAKEDTMARRWQSCQKEFEDHCPHVMHIECGQRARDEQQEFEVPDNKTIETMAEELARKITQEVRHVR